jgi:hypothetical protein
LPTPDSGPHIHLRRRDGGCPDSPLSDHRCLWCNGVVVQARRHGSLKRFCCAGHRNAFWTAARRWVMRAVEAGCSRPRRSRAVGEACTLLQGRFRPVGKNPTGKAQDSSEGSGVTARLASSNSSLAPHRCSRATRSPMALVASRPTRVTNSLIIRALERPFSIACLEYSACFATRSSTEHRAYRSSGRRSR